MFEFINYESMLDDIDIKHLKTKVCLLLARPKKINKKVFFKNQQTVSKIFEWKFHQKDALLQNLKTG